MELLENKRVMIACVTFETYKIVNPAIQFKVDKIYLVHYVKDGDHNSIYYQFFERTRELLKRKIEGIEIVDSEELFGSTKVYEFNTMLKVVLNIINRERMENSNNTVFVNISAGSAEYSAASAVAAMMNEDIAKPFSVNTSEYTVKDEKTMKEMYFKKEKGKLVPVGLASDTYPPVRFRSYNIHKPKKELIEALKIVYDKKIKDGDKDFGMRSSDIIKEMNVRNIWPKETVVTEIQKEKTKNKNSDSVFFFRTYIEKWLRQGWVEHIDKRYHITEKGMNDVEVFLFKGDDGL